MSGSEAQPFWQTKSLDEMSEQEWESLCDGCGKCCVYKIEDDEGQLYQTDVACRYFDQSKCQCTEYHRRLELVPDCIQVTPSAARSYQWLPNTCAYKLLANGKPLPQWHPLITGDKTSVHKANRSAKNKVILETLSGDLEDHVIGIVLLDDPESDPLADIEPE
ncbi:MAG: YcgN family cysteine cluster protein [Kangiellaceae bacterium]|jgi:uncharacterized cysteine cluster protein YcgN (CxxCxxCC family)|nr:YcgN family cysteine cluster protein [Kangiellaceae bacterium]